MFDNSVQDAANSRMNEDFLVFDHVTKRFGALTAVDNVSLTIKRGEFFSLLGPSGCGKTTLLRMLGGFERPDSGRIYLDGKDITEICDLAVEDLKVYVNGLKFNKTDSEISETI